MFVLFIINGLGQPAMKKKKKRKDEKRQKRTLTSCRCHRCHKKAGRRIETLSEVWYLVQEVNLSSLVLCHLQSSRVYLFTEVNLIWHRFQVNFKLTLKGLLIVAVNRLYVRALWSLQLKWRAARKTWTVFTQFLFSHWLENEWANETLRLLVVMESASNQWPVFSTSFSLWIVFFVLLPTVPKLRKSNEQQRVVL